MSDVGERIATALERLVEIMETDRQEMRHAELEAAAVPTPQECEHPREHRYDNSKGAQVRRGCSLCGSEDISKVGA